MSECKHANTSLVEITLPSIGNILSVQCDVCGAMLPRAPIADEDLDAWLDGKLKVPHIDTPAWIAATDRMIHRAFVGADIAELETFAKVMHGR